MDDAVRERNRPNARPQSRSSEHDHARRRVLHAAVRPSPARTDAPEPDAWLPLPDLAALPALEELLRPENLVESGQTIAIRMRARDPQPFEDDPFVHRARVAPAVAAAVSPGVAARRAARAAIRRRQLRLVAVVGVLVLALIGFVMLLLPEDRTARVVVDGAERTVETSGNTVAAALGAAKVWLGPYDRVVPEPSAAIPSTPIRVVRAQPLTVDVDGVMRTALVAATDVAMLRSALGVPDEFQVVGRDTVDPTATLVFRRSVDVALAADGEDQRVTVPARTVGEALEARGIALSEADIVAPSASTVLTPGMRIVVTRVTGSERVEERVVPRGTVRRNDASLPAGTQKVVDSGADGRARVRILTVKRNNTVAEERVVRTEVITPARPQVIAVGTRASNNGRRSTSAPAPAAAPGYTKSETGGATWYAYIPGTCAHKTIPKGTVVKVTNLASGASTTCVVADRGPFAAGRVIDLTPDVFSRIGSLSTGVLSVRLDWS